MIQTDLIIIGAGPGGYETAVLAAKKGKTVTIVEANKVGGTCLNVGCIPTKCFCKNAEIVQNLKEAEIFGIDNLSYSFNFQKVVERKNQVVENLGLGIKSLLKSPGITHVQGKAKLKDANTIVVEGATDINGNPIDTEYSATNIIIATGSVTKFLPIEGAHLPKVLTSTEILDIDHVPERICVIGGGVIGLEFASIFQSFGSKVSVVEFCKEILPNFDSDIAKRLRLSLKSRGINFLTGAGVTAIAQEGEVMRVDYESKGKPGSVEADIVLMAVGRAANTESLNLKDIGIECDRRGIVTNENLETSVKGIYAIGDVNGKCQLAHAASFQGKKVLNHILNEKDKICLDIVPAAVFTNPEAATIGITEDYCKQQNIAYVVKKSFFRSNGKALAMNESEGMVKVIANEEGKILGCHLFGAHAADLIQEIASLMNNDGTLNDLATTIHAHPTLGEVVMAAAE